MKRQIKKILREGMITIIILISCTSIISTEEIYKNPKSIKITVVSGWKPFSYLDSQGNLKGILIDYWKAWGKANKVEVEFSSPTSWSNSLELIKKGEESIHVGLFYRRNRSEYIDFGISIMDLMTGIYLQEDIKAFNINDIKTLEIGVKKNNYARDYLENNYPELKDFELLQTIYTCPLRVGVKKGEKNYWVL